MKELEKRFRYVGFTEIQGSRVFTYQMVSVERGKIEVSVTTNLALARLHKISLQELPLMCQSLLEEKEGADTVNAYLLSEQDMRTHSQRLAERAERARQGRQPKRPHSGQLPGASWRGAAPIVTNGSGR